MVQGPKKKDTYGSQKPAPRPDIGANVVILKYYLFHETYTNLMKFRATAINCGYLYHLSHSLDEVPPKFVFFFFFLGQWNKFDLPIIQN
jgi:hypothetical protein